MLTSLASNTGTEGELHNASGAIENGVYKIDEANGPTLGKYKVEIYASLLPPEIAARTDLDDDARSRYIKQVIPPRYNQQSTLEIDIDSEKVQKNFELTSK